MTHYLSGEIFRTSRRNYLYIALAICAAVLLGVVALFAYANSTVEDPNGRMHLDMLLMFFVNFLPSIGLYFTLLVGDMTFSEEYKIQTMRKDAGFEVMDHIGVYQDGNEKISQLLKDNADTIKSEVMADFITIGQMKGFTKEWNINGENVTLGVEKVMPS